jgi:hypothetical protein
MIYGISRAGMHLWVVRKTCGVTELRYYGNGAQPVPVRLPAGGRFAIRPQRGIIAGQAKLSFFSRHLRIF